MFSFTDLAILSEMMRDISEPRVTLVVLGGGFKTPEEREHTAHRSNMALSKTSKLRALATVERLKTGDVDLVVFAGGYTGGKDLPSEASEMKRYASLHSRGAARTILSNARTEETSKDTSENAELAAPHLLGKVEVLSNLGHSLRGARLFKAFGVSDVIPIHAEKLLWERSKRYRRPDTFLNVATVKALAVEVIANCLLLIDRKGILLRSMTRSRGES